MNVEATGNTPDIFLSLVIPCYNEAATLEKCVERCLGLEEHGFSLELVIVDDCSTDGSAAIADELASRFPQVSAWHHEINMGKGAALITGFTKAKGEYIGIQDADEEYNPLDYIELVKPLMQDKADVVYGSRYLRQDVRRVLYFWHTWMNRTLTFVSNMFTNLDISDMETCYKLFRADVIRRIAPELKEKRFGFEPEITSLVAKHKCRVYECAIHYNPRSYEEGKKIGWKDGLRALYCILHYGAPYAPLPMQIVMYFFIGLCCAIVNVASFCALTNLGAGIFFSVVISFVFAAAINYILCILLLFRHKARWSSRGEITAYLAGVCLMCLLDYLVTAGLFWLDFGPFWSKSWATLIGFFGNFYLRKYFVF